MKQKKWFTSFLEWMRKPPGPSARQVHLGPVYDGPIRTDINFPAYAPPERQRGNS